MASVSSFDHNSCGQSLSGKLLKTVASGPDVAEAHEKHFPVTLPEHVHGREVYPDRSSGRSNMCGNAWASHRSYWSGDHPRSTVNIE